MYPTKDMPGFGVFVKNVVTGLQTHGIKIVAQALIRGKGKNIWSKLFKYIKFYCDIFIGFWKCYDLVYIHYPNMALPVFYPLFYFFDRKVVVNLHGEDLFYFGFWGKILGRLNESFLKKVNLIIVPSEFFKEELLHRQICKENKIFVSPSGGVNCEHFFMKEVSKKDEFSLGYVGRIEHGKGWKEFIEALKLLKNKLNFKAYIVGYGSQENDMLDLIKSYKLSEAIEFVKGVEQRELNNYYNKFDLLIFSTQLPESLGLVGLEAMACGVPVVGTNIGGVATYLNNTNGFPILQGSVISIVNAITSFFNLSVEDKLKLKQGAFFTAQKYNTQIVIENLYQKLLQLM